MGKQRLTSVTPHSIAWGLHGDLAFPVFLPKLSSLSNMVKNKGVCVCVCVMLGGWVQRGAGRAGTDPHGIKPGPQDPAPLLLPLTSSPSPPKLTTPYAAPP